MKAKPTMCYEILTRNSPVWIIKLLFFTQNHGACFLHSFYSPGWTLHVWLQTDIPELPREDPANQTARCKSWKLPLRIWSSKQGSSQSPWEVAAPRSGCKDSPGTAAQSSGNGHGQHFSLPLLAHRYRRGIETWFSELCGYQNPDSKPKCKFSSS